jgi:hypothetical protein
MKGISSETGDAFFSDHSHQTIIMRDEILIPVISDLIRKRDALKILS